jgi:mRNA interferase RelE/StbE
LTYDVLVIRSAEKQLDALPSAIHERISSRILSLEVNPRARGVKKLSGKEEYRLRVGDYRVLFTVDDSTKLVKIIAVGHRREVYR